MINITMELAQMANAFGYRFDIGSITKEEKKALDKRVRKGDVIKCKAYWPWVYHGICTKTCYINTNSEGGHDANIQR